MTSSTCIMILCDDMTLIEYHPDTCCLATNLGGLNCVAWRRTPSVARPHEKGNVLRFSKSTDLLTT
jgi:hypothetical protein